MEAVQKQERTVIYTTQQCTEADDLRYCVIDTCFPEASAGISISLSPCVAQLLHEMIPALRSAARAIYFTYYGSIPNQSSPPVFAYPVARHVFLTTLLGLNQSSSLRSYLLAVSSFLSGISAFQMVFRLYTRI